jgi:hypothetical protein
MTPPPVAAPPTGTAPALVAALRGIIEAALLTAVAVVIDLLSGVDAGDLAPYVPIAVLALRATEGLIDQKVDPTKQRNALGGTNLR